MAFLRPPPLLLPLPPPPPPLSTTTASPTTSTTRATTSASASATTTGSSTSTTATTTTATTKTLSLFRCPWCCSNNFSLCCDWSHGNGNCRTYCAHFGIQYGRRYCCALSLEIIVGPSYTQI
eukprot:TRINITY_DN2284_c0_g2_i6.p1 TRINITY_DN2284_c0_g2~~TRINITY_DN2284_c0_g2_i6.p1  ORF type:complete len:122 (-),score=35.39 TRINITY_DN2284_c0_g2_i6:516-881(-)